MDESNMRASDSARARLEAAVDRLESAVDAIAADRALARAEADGLRAAREEDARLVDAALEELRGAI